MVWSERGDRENPWTGGKNGEKGRVMVVDDHAAFRQAISVVLEKRAGFEVCAQAASPAEAVRALEALGGRLDLAVVDLDLPGPGAEALVRELREGPSGAAVLGLTAERGGVFAGTAGVLCTGDSVEEILSAARQLVG